MIIYPKELQQGQTIGVTAPSSGVSKELHSLVEQSRKQFESRGYTVTIGETVWTQDKAASAPKEKRAEELNAMLQSEEIQAIIPPWGGEILQEILPLVEWGKIQPKWMLGYSDTSTFLFAMTVKTGIATVHGVNLVDLRSNEWDPTTSKFLDVLTSSKGGEIEQVSSMKYQSKWDHSKEPNPYVYQLDTETKWETISGHEEKLSGRLLGGCLDTIRHLIGTPYGDVRTFQRERLGGEPILWYMENCELVATDFHRSLLQMQQAGWFENASGILFGRSSAGQDVGNFTVIDSMERIAELTKLPIVYNVDIGHVPPQLTLVNGAYAEVEVGSGVGKVKMKLV